MQAINPGLPTEGWISATLLYTDTQQSDSWALEGSSASLCKLQISGWVVEMCRIKLASGQQGDQER